MNGDQEQWARTELARASEARLQGQAAEARRIVEAVLVQVPGHAPAWNLLGVMQLESGLPAEASRSLTRGLKVDPAPPFAWFNLARAQRALGDDAGELNSLNAALSRDAYFLPAILAKGETLRRIGRDGEAVELYRLLFEGLGEAQEFPAQLVAKLADARAVLQAHGDRLNTEFSRALAEVAADFPQFDLSRARAYAEQRAGKRKVYVQQPTAGHFPYLPAIEFFARSQFPWLAELETHTAAFRDELLSLWADDDPSFRPYVTYEAGTPLGQWAELNHSPRWSAWFLWENGRRNDLNCARCPKTAAAIEKLPMLDMPGKAPTAMFSVLKPRTRIPPHTGSANARTTIHLPLVVPPGCGFRVGAETREWREGEAWAFDDTIEHEAWNNSDRPRAILIIDGWNPLLSDAEKELVRRIG